MAINVDSPSEVVRKAAEEETPGSRSEYVFKTKVKNESSEPVPVEFALTDTPTITNLSATIAATEYNHSFQSGTRKFRIVSRKVSQLQISYTLGESGTKFITIPRGGWHSEENVDASAVTLYVQSTIGNNIIEILEWS